MSTVPVEEGKVKARPAYKGNPTATTQNVNLGAMEAPTNTKFRNDAPQASPGHGETLHEAQQAPSMTAAGPNLGALLGSALGSAARPEEAQRALQALIAAIGAQPALTADKEWDAAASSADGGVHGAKGSGSPSECSPIGSNA